MARLRLHYSPGACSLAPHVLLNEVEADCELVLTRIADGATRMPDFLRLNPKGRVPVLVVEGRPLTELPAISAYIASLRPEAKLLGGSPLETARVFELFNWLSGTVHGQGFGMLWRAQRFSEDAAHHGAIQAKGRETIEGCFAMIERDLAGPWALGEAYTAVDPFLLVFHLWGHRIELPMRQRYPRWTAQAERVLERPATRRAVETEGLKLPR